MCPAGWASPCVYNHLHSSPAAQLLGLADFQVKCLSNPPRSLLSSNRLVWACSHSKGRNSRQSRSPQSLLRVRFRQKQCHSQPHPIDQSKSLVQPRFKNWKKSLHFLMGEVHFKGHGYSYTEGPKIASFLQSISNSAFIEIR